MYYNSSVLKQSYPALLLGPPLVSCPRTPAATDQPVDGTLECIHPVGHVHPHAIRWTTFLEGFAELFSDSLRTHVKKGIGG